MQINSLITNRFSAIAMPISALLTFIKIAASSNRGVFSLFSRKKKSIPISFIFSVSYGKKKLSGFKVA